MSKKQVKAVKAYGLFEISEGGIFVDLAGMYCIYKVKEDGLPRLKQWNKFSKRKRFELLRVTITPQQRGRRK